MLLLFRYMQLTYAPAVSATFVVFSCVEDA